MRKGELSAEWLPRVYIVFEGIIGVVPQSKEDNLREFINKEDWESAIGCFRIIPSAMSNLVRLWSIPVNYAVVTFLPEGCVPFLADVLDSHGILLGPLLHYLPEDLAQDISSPAILAVIDPDQLGVLRWGNKGILGSSATLYDNLYG